MTNKFTIFAAAFATAFSSLSPATIAYAASPAVEAAKSQCVVGEKNDGYLGVVPGAIASQEVRREIRSINQRRKAAYEQIAARNGVTVQVTASLTAEKLINQAPAGQCVQDGSGAWIKKS